MQSRAGDVDASGSDETRARRSARDRGRFTRNFIVQGTAAEWALAWLAGVDDGVLPRQVSYTDVTANNVLGVLAVAVGVPCPQLAAPLGPELGRGLPVQLDEPASWRAGHRWAWLVRFVVNRIAWSTRPALTSCSTAP